MDNIEDQRIQLNNDEPYNILKFQVLKLIPINLEKHLMRRNFKI